VIELVLGILIGPDVIGLQPTELVTFFADLGSGCCSSSPGTRSI